MRIGPLGFFEKMVGSTDEILVASLHWRRSITWRWALYWRPPAGGDVFYFRRIKCTAPAWMFYSRFVGLMHFQTQKNMWREDLRA